MCSFRTEHIPVVQGGFRALVYHRPPPTEPESAWLVFTLSHPAREWCDGNDAQAPIVKSPHLASGVCPNTGHATVRDKTQSHRRPELYFPLEELEEQAWPGERPAVTEEAITLTANAWSGVA